MTHPVNIAAAARALGVSPKRIRRDLAAGAPVARRGGRGRGRATLIDVDAYEAWRDARTGGGSVDEAVLLELAAELPDAIADAVNEAFLMVDGPHKRDCAGALAGAGYLAVTAVLDRIRTRAPSVPELHEPPDKIARLRGIFAQSRTIAIGNRYWDNDDA